MRADLNLMMSCVGLGHVSLSELGGNIPSQTSPAPDDLRAEDWAVEERVSAVLGAVDGPGAYREDVDPIEMACRIQKSMWQTGKNVTETARDLGRSRAYIRNHIRLLRLPIAVQDHVSEGRLCEGHARAIAKMRDPEAMARLIIRWQVSVRGAEIMARRLRYIGPDGRLLRETAIPNTAKAENMIAALMGYKVRIKDRAGRGQIAIDYNSPKEFLDIIGRLTRGIEGLSS